MESDLTASYWTTDQDVALLNAIHSVGGTSNWRAIASGVTLQTGQPCTPDAARGRYRRLVNIQADQTIDDLRTAVEYPRKTPPGYPSGWEAGVSWNGNGGTLTTGPLERDPKWDDVLRVWNLDPEVYEIVEPVQFRAWDANAGNGEVTRLYSYRATVRQRAASTADLQDLLEEVKLKRTTPSAAPPPSGDGGAFVIAISDPQIGKEGTKVTVARFLAAIDSARFRIEELRASGRPIDSIYILGLGDIVEQCSGHYPMQEFTTELNRRDQVKLARHLIFSLIDALAPLAERIVVAAVGGNHGEDRRNGKAYTDFGDNDDVAVFEQVAEILAVNPREYGHVSVVVPDKQLTLTLNIGGQIVGLAHGHQQQRGAKEWWKGQAFGMQPVGDATILFTGHFHHLIIEQDGPRTHFQCPTMDAGSQWFEEQTGMASAAGVLTVRITPDGWGDLQIL